MFVFTHSLPRFLTARAWAVLTMQFTESRFPSSLSRHLKLALALAGLCFVDHGHAREFEPPKLLVENREGDFGPDALYSRIALGSVPGSQSSLILWTEKRLGTNPFEIDLLGKRFEPAASGPDQLLGTLSDPLLSDGPALWIESAQRVHIVYATRVGGESRLMHRVTDFSLVGGIEEVLDRSDDWLGLPALAPLSNGGFAVCYRHGFDLSYLEVPVRLAPVFLTSHSAPASFALAAVGGSSFIAIAQIERAELGARISSRIELVEVRGGAIRSRETLAELPAQVSALAMAASPAGRLGLVWSDDRFSVPQLLNSEIFGRVREPNGRWLAERRLSHTLEESLAPALIFEGEVLHIVWQDRAFGSFELFHRRLEQETGLDLVTRPDGNRSVTPQLTIAANRLTVVWRDAINGRADIYLASEAAEPTTP